MKQLLEISLNCSLMEGGLTNLEAVHASIMGTLACTAAITNFSGCRQNFQLQQTNPYLLVFSINAHPFSCLFYICRILFCGFLFELRSIWLSCCNGFQVSDTHSGCSRMFNVMKCIKISQVLVQRGAVHKCS